MICERVIASLQPEYVPYADAISTQILLRYGKPWVCKPLGFLPSLLSFFPYIVRHFQNLYKVNYGRSSFNFHN